MKKNWEVKKLKNVCEIQKRANKRNDLPYVGMEHIESNTSNFLGDLNPTNVKSNTFYFDFNNVLYGRLRPYLNKVLLPDFEGHCSTEIFPLKPSPNLNKKFLFYWFSSETTVNQINKTCTGTRMPRANFNKVMEFEIPVPSLSEQRRIVLILDEALAATTKAKENAEKNLKNAREVFESYLQEVFENPSEEWKKNKLGEVSIINYGYTEKASFKEIGPKFLRITDIQDNIVNWDTVPFCSIEKNELSKYRLNDGDIVFARTGATTGKSFLITNPPLSVFASYLIKVQIINLNVLHPQFLYLFFQTKTYWQEINLGMSGSAQGGFNASKLAGMIIPTPPVDVQFSMVSKFDILLKQTQKLESIYRQKIADLDELKKSLLQKAFAGEL